MTTIKKLMTPVTFAIAIVVILVFGVLFSIHSNKQNQVRTLINAYPEARKFVEVDDFEKDVIDVEGTTVTIVKAYDVFSGKDKVGVIYVGETEGYGGPLQIAFGIRFENDSIIGMSIISSNETPERISKLLGDANFLPQFKNKNLADEDFGVDGVSGVTITSNAIDKILQAVRIRYAKDTGFEIPESLKVISKKQNYQNLNEFIYVLEFKNKQVTVKVNQQFEIISIDNEEFNTDEMRTKIANFINNNKITNYIKEVSVNDETNVTTLTIQTIGYVKSAPIITTVEIDSEGRIISFTSNTSRETYNDEYNSRWDIPNGHPNEVIPPRIIDEQKADVDGVAGATVTSNAIKAAAAIAFEYAKEVIK